MKSSLCYFAMQAMFRVDNFFKRVSQRVTTLCDAVEEYYCTNHFVYKILAEDDCINFEEFMKDLEKVERAGKVLHH